MSEIQRYRVNPVKWEDGKGWVKESIHSIPKVYAIEQLHKKGGWCKYEDVKALERQLEEAREVLKLVYDCVNIDNAHIQKRIKEQLKEKQG